MARISTHIDICKIGPHISLVHNGNVGRLKLGIYANNGNGKSFISRMFRLAEDNSSDLEKSDSYITLRQRTGHFKYKISNLEDTINPNRTLDITIQRGEKPIVQNDTGYLFHVFNSDYVEENLSAYKYSPDGNIEGYVLGKTNIDVTIEKANLKIQNEEKERLKTLLDGLVSVTLTRLDGLGINKNTSEYKQVSFDNIFTNGQKDVLTFKELNQMHQALKAMPTDLADIPPIQQPNFSDFNTEEIKKLFESSFSQSLIAEEFKQKIKLKEVFIESGLNFYDSGNKKCPFCEQDLSLNAIALITQYTRYFNDIESKTRKLIDELIGEIKATKKSAQSFYTNYLLSNKKYDEVKRYIPSFFDKTLPIVSDFKEINQFDELISLLEKKKESLSKTDFVFFVFCNLIQNLIQEYSGQAILINRSINQLNGVKNNQSSEKLSLNKRLCISAFSEAKKKEEVNINLYKDTIAKIKDLNYQIEEKENKAKASKKSKVIESLKLFLNFFFKDKYIFDEATFSIKFQEEVLGNQISNVLSDGEKSVVSLCYYLAETHKIVTNETDYQNVFFVIDDPISSMDFHYVYAVTQIIRNLKGYFNIDKSKYLILTHNVEFMSILMYNKIIDGNYILENAKLEKLNKELIMPYEAHLRDVYNVTIGIKEPNHTIPNSIRHIIETINRFEDPTKTFEEYFNNIADFEDNEFLYSLIQDCSHGRIRQQQAYTNETIKAGCERVIQFIENRYQGQIVKIRN